MRCSAASATSGVCAWHRAECPLATPVTRVQVEVWGGTREPEGAESEGTARRAVFGTSRPRTPKPNCRPQAGGCRQRVPRSAEQPRATTAGRGRSRGGAGDRLGADGCGIVRCGAVRCWALPRRRWRTWSRASTSGRRSGGCGRTGERRARRRGGRAGAEAHLGGRAGMRQSGWGWWEGWKEKVRVENSLYPLTHSHRSQLNNKEIDRAQLHLVLKLSPPFGEQGAGLTCFSPCCPQFSSPRNTFNKCTSSVFPFIARETPTSRFLSSSM